MNQFLFTALSVLFFLTISQCQNAVKPDPRIQTVHKFLMFLEQKQEDSLRRLIAMDPINFGVDSFIFQDQLNKFAVYFQKYGIPDQSKFQIRNGKLDGETIVTVPFDLSKDTSAAKPRLISLKIELSFAELFGYDKVAYYSVLDKYEIDTTPIILPGKKR
ncbi:hypothetical protein DVR12_26930 [Chitinophaga silvatica]|uniref:Nuclear transport factor 2 family protein n=1 Tax=Chitinophaga silvatica TaxID=2282649 RepID=A0A3E1Y212_9BACT|nr:hypothetical protein [Chitinophaga silvatica]RFS18683.1 hypothetical protein DVR12_26930 [Chitinophaga silvatica]